MKLNFSSSIRQFFKSSVRDDEVRADERQEFRDSSPSSGTLEHAKALEEREGHAAALAYVDRELDLDPSAAELFMSRGSILYSWGRMHEAYDEYQRAAKAGSANPQLSLRLGWVCRNLGRFEESLTYMRTSVEKWPEQPETNFSLGVVLHALKHLDEAMLAYEKTLTLDPAHLGAKLALAMGVMEREDLEKAEHLLLQIVEVDARHIAAWINIGIIRTKTNREDAADAFANAQRAATETNSDGDATYQYAHFLHHSKGRSEALEICENDLIKHPQSFSTSLYGMALLSAGRLVEGWNFYEFRWAREPLLSLRAQISKPVWAGQDLAGKTILLRAEQGIGDVIQFIRYAPLVRALGARVLFQSRDGMGGFPARFQGVDAVIDTKLGTPDFDYYIHLMSLPRVFRTSLDSIPNHVPYIEALESRASSWGAKMPPSARLKVGLVWAGRPTHVLDRWRSMAFSQIAPLLDDDRVSFYSLQKGDTSKQLAPWKDRANLVDLAADLTDLDDAAAAIANLDIVIAVDTAIAHLAGAMGKDVWILLRKPAEWRWLEEGTQSKWYPTARLFRQSLAGDWTQVVQQVREALDECVRAKASSSWTSALKTLPRNPQKVDAPTYAPMEVKPGMSAAAEMKYGIFQYIPALDEACLSLGWYGEWRERQLQLLISLLRQGQTIVELGAHVGAHTVPLADALGNAGHVIAYEASTTLRRLLLQNIRANRLTNVTLIDAVPAGSAAPHNCVAAAVAQEFEAASRTESIDDLRPRKLDWIICTDGINALTAIRCSENTIWRLRPKLFLRVGDEAEDVHHALSALGYRVWIRRDPLYNDGNFQGFTVNKVGDGVAKVMLGIPEEIEADVALPECVELV